LQGALTDQSEALEHAYGGFCAPYLTVRSMALFLRELGLIVSISGSRRLS